MKTLHSFTRIFFILHLFEISLYYLLAFLYFRWYNAIIPNLRQNSNISVRSAGDQSILGVLPAITQHRTSASGFWEIPGASWPAARRSRSIPAADTSSGSPAQLPFLTRTPPRIPKLTRSFCNLRVTFPLLTRSLSRLPQNTGSRNRVCQRSCGRYMSHVSFNRVFLSGAARPCHA